MKTKSIKNAIINIIKYLYSLLFTSKCLKITTYPLNDIDDTYSNDVKNALNKFFDETYKPTHYLTIRLPEHWETADIFKSNDKLRMIMKVFERSLLGVHWNRKHLPFIATAEHGVGVEFHYNVLFNKDRFTDEELQNAIDNVTKTLPLSDYCLFLEQINYSKDKVNAYCLKEIKIDENNKFDSDRIIFSHDLFNLSYKNQ